MYMPITDFSTLRRIASLPERFMAYHDNALYPVWLRPGTRIQFSTKIIPMGDRTLGTVVVLP